MDCPNCKNKFTLCRGKKYPTCEACGQPYCTVDCINFHKEEHIESTQCKNKQDRELIAQIYDKLSRDYQWRCKEMIVLAISPVVYTNRKHLPSVRMDRDLIYNMYGPYGMNWHLIRSVSDFVSKNMVDRMILRVCEFIEEKKHIDGMVVIASGHGSPTIFCTSDGIDFSFATIYYPISA
eukprot:191307_1